MNDLYELIEAYLNDDLPADQRRDMERRMAEDPAFRDEVELHRQLQQTYADPGRWQLQEALAAIMDEPVPPDKSPPETPADPTRGNRKTWTLIAVALLMGAGIWFFSRQSAPSPQPTGDHPTAPPNPAAPVPAPTAPTEKELPPANKPKTNRPIAMADPADFAPNPTMETYVGSRVRSTGGMQVTMTVPQNGATVQPNAQGASAVRFAGRLEGAAPDDALVLHLQIFNNRGGQNPLLTQPVQLRTDAAGQADFDLTLRLNVPKGLYYFRVEESKSEEMLVVGKFFVGRL